MPKPFLTPPETPAETECRTLTIPGSKEWLGIFNSALLEATYSYNFTQVNPTDLTPEEAAEICQQIVWAYFESECGSSGDCPLPGTEAPPFRISAGGHLQQAVGGEWQAPEGIYELPDVPPRTNPSEIDRICLASANAAKTLSDTYEAMIDAYNEDIDPDFGLAQLAGTTSAAIAVGLGYISFGLGTVIFGVFQLFYEAFQWLTTDSWDAAFTEKVECYLIECASDDVGVVTFDYDCFMQKVSADSNLTEDLTDIRRFAQIWYMMQFIGVEGLNLAGATTAITDPECGCNTWCYEFDFTTSNGGFAAITQSSPIFWQAVPVWVSSQGWVAGEARQTGSNNRWQGASVVKTFAATTVTDIEFHCSATAGQCSTGSNCDTWSLVDSTGTVIQGEWVGNPTPGVFSWTGSRTMSSISPRIQSSFCTNGCVPSGAAVITKLVLRGTGTNPFGADNC